MPALNAVSPDLHSAYLSAVPPDDRCNCSRYEGPCVSRGLPDLCATCARGCTEVVLFCNGTHIHHQHVKTPDWAKA